MQVGSSYVIPTFHPAFLLRGMEHYIDIAVRDLQRAERVAVDGWRRDDRIYLVLPNGGGWSPDQAINWIEESARVRTEVVLDTETYGVGHRSALDQYTCGLRAVGMSFGGTNEGLSMPFDGSLGPADTLRLRRAVAAVTSNVHIVKCYQNFGYDVEVLDRHGMPHVGPARDSVILHHITDPDYEHDLAFIAHQILDVDPWKADYRRLEKMQTNSLRDLLFYNGKDALHTQQCIPTLLASVAEIDQNHIVDLELRTGDLARRMGRVGVPIDEACRRRIEVEIEAKRDKALAFMRAQLNWPEYEPQKPDHRIQLFYERLKFPVKFYTEKKAQPSTGRRALIEHLDNPIVQAQLDFDSNAKLVATFLRKLPSLVDDYGRLHVHWNNTGTLGSRWSSQPNFQNYPNDIRHLVAPRRGRVLVGADSKAIEYRIISALAGCTKLNEKFNRDDDVHSEVATLAFGDAFALLDKKDPVRKDLRVLAKRVVYAGNYMAADKTIYENLRQDPNLPVGVRASLSIPIVGRIMKARNKAYPEIMRWAQRTWEQVNRTGVQLIEPLGRKRIYPVLPVEITVSSNSPIQFAAGDFHNISILGVDAELPKGADVILNVHDQIVVECYEKDAESVKKLIEEKMTHRLDGPGGHVMLGGEGAIGSDWKKV
jgi:DNA polymerase-1